MTEVQNLGFRTKQGQCFQGIGSEDLSNIHRDLISEYGLICAQVCEAASYSMAMVIRYALGLSAQGGNVIVLYRDNLNGQVALATLRHLINAGATASVYFWPDSTEGPDLELQLRSLKKSGICPGDLKSALSSDFERTLNASHNLICGLFDRTNYLADSKDSSLHQLIGILNEARTPIHCIEAPLGVNVDSGIGLECPLYASSTLSLGAPLAGLSPGNEYVGRHYLCDISVAANLYSQFGPNLCPLFSEQPVNQIFPLTEEDLQVLKGENSIQTEE